MKVFAVDLFKRLVLIVLLLALIIGTARAGGHVQLVKVLVACTGDDLLGVRVCSTLKEKLRASSGFELVELPAALVFCVHLTSVDSTAHHTNAASALAVVFTVFKADGTELFVTQT
jgi:hypothetical protein